ncbi:MAG: FkbM family methyltransferase [Rhizobiaceae bacterium]|nr:FkbM family methyltransferase [Rhizobiaceae bacterium]
MVVHDIHLPLSRDDVSPVIWDELVSGRYEAKEVKAIRRSILVTDRVLELGAGLGIVTSVIASLTDATVRAYEANPATVDLAKRIIASNDVDNIRIEAGLLTAGAPRSYDFYVRRDLWMSSLIAEQGPYESVITLQSRDIDREIDAHEINVLVMDIEGAERELLRDAKLNGVERILLELHDHLYGLEGVRDIMHSMTAKGFAYDPRGSSGPCVLFSKDYRPRTYQAGDDLE